MMNKLDTKERITDGAEISCALSAKRKQIHTLLAVPCISDSGAELIKTYKMVCSLLLIKFK